MDMDLEQKAIMRLREAADTSERFYKAPLIVTTSGGKDSSVCVALAEKGRYRLRGYAQSHDRRRAGDGLFHPPRV